MGVEKWRNQRMWFAITKTGVCVSGFQGVETGGGGRTAGEDEDAIGEFDHGEGPGDVHEVYHVARSGE